MKTDSLSHTLDQIVGREFVATQPPRFDLDEVPLACPASTEEVSELLKFAAREKLRVIPLGLGSKLGWCGAPEHVDFLISTRRLVGAVSHEPEDGTISVRAGETMAALAERVERGGHRLTPDVAFPERGTIGGAIAAGQCGVDRLRFGPLRHHVLGLQVVLGDGTVTRTGGQLVKNVTGFDLQRLYAGSHGTLGVITEASLRLFPAPEHELWFAAAPRDLGSAFELARAALALPLRLVSTTIVSIDPPTRGSAWALFARLFGKRAAVNSERQALASCWPGASAVEGREAREFAHELRDNTSFLDAQHPSISIGAAPSRVSQLAADLVAILDAHKAPRRIAIQPGEARVELELPNSFDASACAAFARQVRDLARRHGATAHLRNATVATLAQFPPFADEVVGIQLMRELQSRLDPQSVFARGRFVGGL